MKTNRVYIVGGIEMEKIDALLEEADDLIREDEEAIREYEESMECYLLLKSILGACHS